MTGNTYTTKALYDVIKLSLLMKDKDLVYFIKTMNDNILDDVKKIKKSGKLTTNEIINMYESYTIVLIMIRSILQEAGINQDKAREITDFFLTDELRKKKNKLPPSVYDEEE